MYRVLIVDDEPIICYGLSKIIPWEEYSFEIVGFAYNGREALDIIDERQIDLIITDIRMPAIDGLELCRLVSKTYLNIKIIVISGYSDFEYARKAIEYDVKAYLLKPIIPNELIVQLENVKRQLEDIKKREQEQLKERKQFKAQILDEFVDDHANLEDIRRQLKRSIEEMERGKEGGNLIDEVINYVDNNYCKDISLSSIADEFYANAAYLGRLFKETKGISFSQYLNRKRIAKAREMYLTGEYRVYEIIEAVGYKHSEYFYRQFKRYEGISFAEFRGRVDNIGL